MPTRQGRGSGPAVRQNGDAPRSTRWFETEATKIFEFCSWVEVRILDTRKVLNCTEVKNYIFFAINETIYLLFTHLKRLTFRLNCTTAEFK